MKKRSKLFRILTVICFLLAVFLMCYPLIGNILSEKYHSDLKTAYTNAVEKAGTAEFIAAYDAAAAYNTLLSDGISNTSTYAYPELLNITGQGIMGYVDIPSLGIYLPICHGTDAKTLEQAVGHVMGTSLPVGGSNTHAVLSAHSGMSSSKLFSDIDKLTVGDTFLIHVLDQTLAYEIDQIRVVDPTDTSLLAIEDGMDYVTLVTCTPFGINTHRLLVRGHRTEVPEVKLLAADTEISTPVASTWMQHYLRGLGISLGAFILLLSGYFIFRRRSA